MAVSWLALHTHYYAVFILLAQNIFVLASAWRDANLRPKLLPWLTAQVALFGLYLPCLIMARATLTGYGGAGDSLAFEPMLRRLLSAFPNWSQGGNASACRGAHPLGCANCGFGTWTTNMLTLRSV